MTTHLQDYIKSLEAIADAVIHADNGAKHNHEGVVIQRSAHMALKEKLAHAVRMGAYVEFEK